MIVILVVLQNQPLGKWPLGLTLITILSKVASAALILPISEAIGQLKWSWFHGKNSKDAFDFEIFDKASRGAGGSFLLLCRTRGRSLAAMGAVLTLLLLAIDTFFQQVTDLPTKWTLYGEGLVPRVVRYESDNPKDFQDGVETITADKYLLPVSETFFLANGTMPVVFGNGNRPEIPLSCPTNNCTWPPYDTLGLCGKCVETPQLLKHACLPTRVDWTSTLNATVSSYPNTTVCGYFLNATTADPTLMSGYIMGPDGAPEGETLVMRTLPLISNPLRIPLWGGSINFKQVRNPIFDVLISSIVDKAQVHAHVAPALHECMLEWCVKTIESFYWEGSYHEKVSKTYKNGTARGPLWSVRPYNDDFLEMEYFENVTISTVPEGSIVSEPAWGVSNDTMFNTVIIFDRLFPAFATVANDSVDPLLRWRLGHKTQVRTKALKAVPWLTSDDIAKHMERLAVALTNAVRSGSASTELVPGKAFLAETYVAVHWAWLAFPIAMLSLSIIFLSATIVKTNGGEEEAIGMWKTSAMPTLIYSLPQDVRDKLSSFAEPQDKTQENAQEVKIRLVPNQGWRVSGQLRVFQPVRRGTSQAPPGWI
jgi:hypothetical protein